MTIRSIPRRGVPIPGATAGVSRPLWGLDHLDRPYFRAGLGWARDGGDAIVFDAGGAPVAVDQDRDCVIVTRRAKEAASVAA